MSVVVLLDAGPLGLVTNRSGRSEVNACRRWLASLLDAGTAVHVPAIADYEVRRELLRADKITGLARLDALVDSLGYVPITRQAMLQAAHIWSSARRQGRQTAPDASLDGDCVLARQALTLGREVVVATTNVGHLNQWVPAMHWRDIPPSPISTHTVMSGVLPFNLVPLSRPNEKGVTDDLDVLVAGKSLTLHIVRGFLVAYTDSDGVLWGPGLTADLPVQTVDGSITMLRFRHSRLIEAP